MRKQEKEFEGWRGNAVTFISHKLLAVVFLECLQSKHLEGFLARCGILQGVTAPSVVWPSSSSRRLPAAPSPSSTAAFAVGMSPTRWGRVLFRRSRLCPRDEGSRGPRDGLLILLSSGQSRPDGVGQVLQADQVAVLVASGGPGHIVAKVGVGWRWESLAEVDHPDAGVAFLVVEEEQGAPNHLGGREQGG